ncbi:unnamed protein product, partial [Symbiodinium necroappetens]
MFDLFCIQPIAQCSRLRHFGARGRKWKGLVSRKRKQFFADFSDEMPDEEAALVYWAELGENTLHLFELFLQCGKPVAAVAAASELGRPEEALQLLHKCQVSWEDWHCYTLDILMTAVQQKKLSDNQARGLGKASRTLRSSLPEGALQARVRLDYVDAVLRCARLTPRSKLPQSSTCASEKSSRLQSVLRSQMPPGPCSNLSGTST